MPILIVSEAIPIPGTVQENDICHTNSSTSLISLDSGSGSRSGSLSEDPISELEDGWIPHCFVKSKSKEVGKIPTLVSVVPLFLGFKAFLVPGF
ncbi:hypothetical protein OESDEN_04910 [Oesophagostomum dentatum]|uniref:Uncharacterized protein n=1 Tax=Oesophagostomum dentatum TaxID=61180 RepID=A0A0B1TD37_OESDE|nr:hypothetical protein OESDEN_04910 [Oesophagostomum dentatum]